MNTLKHIVAKAEHVIFHVFDHYWPFLLVALAVGFVFLMMASKSVAKNINRRRSSARRSSGHNPPPADHPAPNLGSSVQDSLLNLSPAHYTFFSDLYLPRPMNDGLTHLDHVVASRQGIFVIQVVESSGPIFGTAADQQWLQMANTKAVSIPNPIIRNAFHIGALSHFLQLPEPLFRSIIVFTGNVKFQTPPPPNVLTSGVGRYISSQPPEPLITNQILTQANYALEKASRETHRGPARQFYRDVMKRRRKSSRRSN